MIVHSRSYLHRISLHQSDVQCTVFSILSGKPIERNFLLATMAQYDRSKDESAKQQQQDDERKTPETLQTNIPVIDLAGIDGPERQKICQQIAQACETWGFFQLINHGIDDSLIKRAKDVSMDFFHGPKEEKLKIKVEAPRHDGWNHSEHMSEGNNLIRKDTVEHLFLYYYPERQVDLDRFPQRPASFRSTLLEYTKELQFLGEKLLRILSENLGLAPETVQSALTTGGTSQALSIAMRTNFYGLDGDGEALSAVCHAHSDPGSLTILLADDAPGLEVRKDGQWVKVNPIPGGFIVNVADMLEVCSNGRFKSVEHRGMPSHKQERLTLATFQSPELDAVVGPIRSLLDESHPPLYKTSSFGAYIAAFVKSGLDGKGGLERHKL